MCVLYCVLDTDAYKSDSFLPLFLMLAFAEHGLCPFLWFHCKGRRTHTRQPQPHAMQQQIDTNFVEFTPCASSKPRHKALLGCGAAAGDTCGKDRTGPILCSVQLCCSQSQLGHQPARASDKMADRAVLFDSKTARRIRFY